MQEQKRNAQSRVFEAGIPMTIEDHVLLLGAHIRHGTELNPVELHAYLTRIGDSPKAIICQAPAHRKFYAGTILPASVEFVRLKPEAYGVYKREDGRITEVFLPADHIVQLQPLEHYLALEGISRIDKK
jgi:hypothetical protein